MELDCPHADLPAVELDCPHADLPTVEVNCVGADLPTVELDCPRADLPAVELDCARADLPTVEVNCVGGDLLTVEVGVLSPVPTPLIYRVPLSLVKHARVGALVRVPLRGKSSLGVILAEGKAVNFPLKSLQSCLYPQPVLTTALIALVQWMVKYYGGTFQAALESALPSVAREVKREKLPKVLSLGKNLNVSRLRALEKKAPRQAILYRYIQELGAEVLKSLALKSTQVGFSSCAALVEGGLLKESFKKVDRFAASPVFETVLEKPLKLNEEQQAALDSILKSSASGQFHAHLLWGVTGSGKTEVYLQAARSLIEQGKSVLFLVPEVSLTPQIADRLKRRFGQQAVCLWHSRLSISEKKKAWRSMFSGQVKAVLGPRSAIFAPLKRVGLVIVDEEHDSSYKQAEAPRYQGRDVAVYRAMLEKAVCVLGSATPSLESLRNVRLQRYKLNELKRRVDQAVLPLIRVVDMRQEKALARSSGLSRLLREKLLDRLEQGQQSILFLNRRAFSLSVFCHLCGFTPTCPHCDLTLRYHRFDQSLKCHICRYVETKSPLCPNCQASFKKYRGLGTQKVEAALKQLDRRFKVARVDSDTVAKQGYLETVLAHFALGKLDVLVGTQMISKGLDFPNVTLVGVVDADLSLRLPDFRSSERCFQLLVQVAGRSGRGDASGEVILQSTLPHHPAIQYARSGDIDGFIEDQLAQRREFNYPPFRHFIRHVLKGPDQQNVWENAEAFARLASRELGDILDIKGPAAAPVEKIRDNYRFHIFYFVATEVPQVVARLEVLRRKFQFKKKACEDFLDVDALDTF